MYFLMLFYILHQAQGYAIKMQGKLEVGQDLAVIFQDIANTYLGNNQAVTEVDISKMLKAVNDLVLDKPQQREAQSEYKRKGFNKEKKQQVKENSEDEEVKGVLREFKEKTLSEEIAGNQEKVHVYGKHSEDKKDSPFNNINV